MGTKWVDEIAEHCRGVKIVLCALKCDLREELEKDDDDPNAPPSKHIITYNEGLEVARKIGALRYLGTYRFEHDPCIQSPTEPVQNAVRCATGESTRPLLKLPESHFKPSRPNRKTAASVR